MLKNPPDFWHARKSFWIFGVLEIFQISLHAQNFFKILSHLSLFFYICIKKIKVLNLMQN